MTQQKAATNNGHSGLSYKRYNCLTCISVTKLVISVLEETKLNNVSYFYLLQFLFEEQQALIFLNRGSL